MQKEEYCKPEIKSEVIEIGLYGNYLQNPFHNWNHFLGYVVRDRFREEMNRVLISA